ncbi:MAG: Bax inhibitor-1 family protein [Rubrivivax sp.]
MNPNVEVLHGSSLTLDADRQRVLRNTYALLALSMLPTVLGAWFGMSTGLAAAMSPMVGLVVFLAGAYGFMFAIEKYKNSGAGVALLLGFTFFMGVMLARLLGLVLSKGNGASLVMMAFAGTSAVFFGMALLSTMIKRDLSGLSRFLFIGAIGVMVVGIANVFIGSGALMLTLSVLVVFIFSAFILVDLKRVRDGEETNYVTATLGVYLSLYNVFQSLLAMFGVLGGDD